jgi:quercetin dioxygenase-like cupin family protein
MSQLAGSRIDVDPYLEWIANEGLPVVEGLAIDCFEVETAAWARTGVKGAALHLNGRGDFSNVFLIDIPAGRSTTPQRHLYEEVIFVLQGRGSTQLEFAGGEKRSFEWGPCSLFSIPINAKHRHFNASGAERALMASTTSLPMVLNAFHNERFVFDNPFAFDERIGKSEYYTGEADEHLVRQGNDHWETNFVPDLGAIELPDFSDRGAGGGALVFLLADSTMHAHIAEMPVGTYKKAHRHPSGIHVMCVAGSGYSLMWFDGDADFERIDWKLGVIFPPETGQFHQHFTTSDRSARYLGIGAFGNLRYPITRATRRNYFADKAGEKQFLSRSTKEGGNQIEYEDQDPRIHRIYLEEMQRQNLPHQMDWFFPDGST